MKNTIPSVNLFRLRKKKFLDKFIAWALSLGRVVVILTETIALLAFLYRFSLDRQLVDLHQKIKQKQAIVNLLRNNEDKYRNLQDRLSLAEQLTTTNSKTITTLNEVNALIPTGVTVTSLLFSPSSLKIDASVQSVASLTDFVKALRDYPAISSVSLDRVENKTTNAVILVSLTATLK